jgi:hypothetical protein
MKIISQKTIFLMFSIILIASGIILIYKVEILGESYINAEISKWAAKNYGPQFFFQGICVLGIAFLIYDFWRRELTAFFYLFIFLFVILLLDFAIQAASKFTVISDPSWIKYLLLLQGNVMLLGGMAIAIASAMIKTQKEIPASKYRFLYIILAVASFIIAGIIGFLYSSR